MFPALFRPIRPVTLIRERVELADGDFLDLEWSGKDGERLVILSHGLEASARTEYMQGLAAALMSRGWDVLAWTYRGCGEEPNRLLRMYHSGATEDLEVVVAHGLAKHAAAKVDLVGFSLGGNMTLKFLGERDCSALVRRAAAISVPCDLACSAGTLAKRSNRIYMERFLRKMRAKLRRKDLMFPGQLDLAGLDKIRDFAEFDGRYTAPIHGFEDAEDYWTRSSCRRFLGSIGEPTLLLNALNDPFLGADCYPFAEAEGNGSLFFEAPDQGGHVGFPAADENGENWMERRVCDFLGQ